MPHEISQNSLLVPIRGFWQHRYLIIQLIKREVVGRYQGSLLGLLWSFFNPLLMLAVYTFFFGVVFQTRWPGASGSRAEFAVILFTGMILHAFLAECLNRAPGLILGNANYVKKVVFPLEILPLVTIGAALFHGAVSVGVLLVFFFLIHHYLHWTVILLPLLVIPFVLMIAGASWFLAATGVFLRDVGQTMGIVTTVLLFLSPVFYPLTALPAALQPVFILNPLTFVVEQTRNLVIWGKTPDLYGLLVYFLASAAVAWAGLFWFRKLRKGFADVL